MRALELLAHRRLDRPFDPAPFERPPLLGAGLEVVLAAAAETPQLVANDSTLARIALDRFPDSPWSTWRPAAGVSQEALRAPKWLAQ